MPRRYENPLASIASTFNLFSFPQADSSGCQMNQRRRRALSYLYMWVCCVSNFFLSFPFLKTLSGPGLEELNEALYQWPLAPI